MLDEQCGWGVELGEETDPIRQEIFRFFQEEGCDMAAGVRSSAFLKGLWIGFVGIAKLSRRSSTFRRLLVRSRAFWRLEHV
jgi:hypothetical protein